MELRDPHEFFDVKREVLRGELLPDLVLDGEWSGGFEPT